MVSRATTSINSDAPSPASEADKASVRRKRNRAGRPTSEELARRKAKVMQVATDMFVKRGYAATTLLEIAKKSRVATRTLYQHFGDKEDIFREVIFARDIATVEAPMLEDSDDLRSALRKAARYAFEVSLRTRSIELMRLMIAESARFPELMTRVANATFTRFKAQLAEFFAALAARGLIPDDDHVLSADLFADLLLGNRTVMIYFGWISTPPTERDIAVKVDLFIAGRFRVDPAQAAKTPAPERDAAAPLALPEPTPAKPRTSRKKATTKTAV